jgi:hypothetical protein
VPSLRCPPANRHPVSEKAPVDPTHWSGAFSFSLISYRAGAKARPRHEEKVGRAIRPHRARDKKLVPMATSSRDFFRSTVSPTGASKALRQEATVAGVICQASRPGSLAADDSLPLRRIHEPPLEYCCACQRAKAVASSTRRQVDVHVPFERALIEPREHSIAISSKDSAPVGRESPD